MTMMLISRLKSFLSSRLAGSMQLGNGKRSLLAIGTVGNLYRPLPEICSVVVSLCFHQEERLVIREKVSNEEHRFVWKMLRN
ncbi:hypothetical protein NC652_004340 [Populus alba x Populus x berolinensis]|nr:hypothetical protein NC652_004340 [Populus alba x Populus x berolinensis]